ncbi:MAG: alanine/ornithine racemase family PLP-dependent enzyme [Clostridia bacterium]|nr:alanine/ornithine racemase family PLP-dependent enzyme [Clostridia bacterium]
MYPNVEIFTDRIVENAKKMKALCNDSGITLSVVTKLVSDCPEITKKLVESSVDCICESRMENVKSYENIPSEKWFIRQPMMSEIDDVVKLIDVSLNSEWTSIKALDEAAKKLSKKHKVILMYELGDLREGCDREELFEIIEKTLKLDNIILYGIGVNLCCYGGVIPSEENMAELSFLAEEIEEKFNIKLPVISGGNSGNLKLLLSGKLPKKINNLRMGESIFLGNIPCFEEPLENFNRDNFILNAQIVEIRRKPSVPRGTRYTNSFGEETKIVDRGERLRALIAIGKQDVSLSGLTPTDKGIDILGGSSDYIILDVTDSEKNYKVGDVLSFTMNYAATLRVMTSQYVEKIIK